MFRYPHSSVRYFTVCEAKKFKPSLTALS